MPKHSALVRRFYVHEASPRASLIYQHATAERDTAVAAALDALAASPRPAPVVEVVQIRPTGS